MILEPIQLQDIPELIEMSRTAHQESKYSHLPFSEPCVRQTFESHITDGFAMKVSGACIGGFFLGAIAGLVFTGTPISMETSYYVRPEYRGTRCFYLLIKAFITWSGNRPIILMPHFGRDNEKLYSALEKSGFTNAGRIYTRGM